MSSNNVQVNPDLDCQDRFWWRIGGGERLCLPREKPLSPTQREKKNAGGWWASSQLLMDSGCGQQGSIFTIPDGSTASQLFVS